MARASLALNGFRHTLSCCNSSTNTAVIPTHLCSALLSVSSSTKRIEGLKYQDCKRHATVTPFSHLRDDSVDGEVHGMRGLPLEVERLISSPRRLKAESWATAIEPYFPSNLCLGSNKLTEEVIERQPMRPIHTLPDILSIARSSCRLDLLSYIGVNQGRWEAVIWLVKAMMEKYPAHTGIERASCQLPRLLWDTLDKSLDDVTSNAIKLENPPPSEASRKQDWLYSGFSFDDCPSLYHPDHRDDPRVLGRKSLGQIWQSLGTMILQAADHPVEDTNYSVIMFHVFQILGYLHRINAFPDSIYNFATAADPTVIQRPPTLYVLSKRIMSTLSDVEWGLQWEETITWARSLGYEMPKAIVRPKIREFDPGLWLDLILWACVEGGWISEGAWIVMEMQRRAADKNTRWSTISWPEICERKAPKLSWRSMFRFAIDKTQLNQVGGIGIATGTNEQIDMGTRTVSREVVLALLDGLLNGPLSTAGGPIMTPLELRRNIVACKSLLDCKHPELDGNFMDAVILRLFESFEDVKEQPGLFSRFLDLRSTELKQATGHPGATDSAYTDDMDDAAAVLGLHHRILHRCSIDGNQEGCLRTFKKIQSIVDTQREGKILAFAHELRERLGRGDDVSDLTGNEGDPVPLVQLPQVPLSALVSFIDLITNSRLLELGNWLLLNDDIDGGLMDPALYSNQSIQPALLRFGTATSDSRLLTKILQGLKMPLSEPIVHALLQFQANSRRWAAVEELLEYFKNAPDMAWKPSDATVVAKVIMQMEHESPDHASSDSTTRALSILQDLVNGKYNSKADPSNITPDFFQTRIANQLGRVLQTLPGSLSKITTRPRGQDLRAHASADITPHAFTVLVETIANIHGSLAGKKLWDRWCRVVDVPNRERQTRISFGDGGERVVTPTPHMLRTVLRPLLETRRALHAAMKDELIKRQQSKKEASIDQDDLSSIPVHEKFKLGVDDEQVIQWGIGMFKDFGLSEDDINGEIPGSFPRPQHRRKKAVKDEEEEDVDVHEVAAA